MSIFSRKLIFIFYVLILGNAVAYNPFAIAQKKRSTISKKRASKRLPPKPTPKTSPLSPESKDKPTAAESHDASLDNVDFDSSKSASFLSRPSVHFLGGLSVADEPDASPRPTYGLGFSIPVNHELSMGLDFLVSRESKENIGAITSFQFDIYSLRSRIIWHVPPRFFEGMEISANFGLARINYRISSTVLSNPIAQIRNTLNTGARVAYLIPFGKHFSAGPSVDYNFYFEKDQLTSFSLVDLTLDLRLHF